MPTIKFNITEKIQIIKWYYGGNTFAEIVKLFSNTFPGRPIPAISTIFLVVRRFQKCGCVQTCKHCIHAFYPPKPRQLPEVKEIRDTNVCGLVEASPSCSIKVIALECNVSSTSTRRILQKYGYKSFKISKCHEIYEGDMLRRMLFCEEVMERSNNDPNFLKFILFYDDSTFSVDGDLNSTWMRYWSTTKKNHSALSTSQSREKLNVWVGMIGDHVIGPFFSDENLNQDNYLNLLQTQIIPALKKLNINLGSVMWQVDNSTRVKVYLDSVLCSYGNIAWPPRSPDLSPNDFFLWDYLKSSLYKDKHERPKNLEDLRAKINTLCNAISPQILENVRRGFYDRLGYCLASKGGVFENQI